MKKALLVTALLATVGYGGYRLVRGHGGGSDAATVDDSKLALDRLWIDHMPRNERDMFHLFAAVSEEKFGVWQHTSSWKGSFELFMFKPSGDKLRIVYPQDNDKEEVSVKAKPCNEGQMDYCMEVSGSSRGVKKYYSRKGWEIDSHMTSQQIDQAEHDLALQLEAGLPADSDSTDSE